VSEQIIVCRFPSFRLRTAKNLFSIEAFDGIVDQENSVFSRQRAARRDISHFRIYKDSE
jgi:hypothetical protein